MRKQNSINLTEKQKRDCGLQPQEFSHRKIRIIEKSRYEEAVY